ncbi:hypothetical protein RUND412_009795 [Rhizina undulata]
MAYFEKALMVFSEFDQPAIRRYMAAVDEHGMSREGLNFSTPHEAYNTLLRLVTTMRAAYQAYNERTQRRPSLLSSRTTITPGTARKNDCLERDNHRCVITNCDGWAKVAHIVPFSQCNDERMLQGEFWKFIEMFLRKTETNRVWGLVGGANVNDSRNLITLDSTLHKMFDNFKLLIKPVSWSVSPAPHDFLCSEWGERSYGLQPSFVNHPSGWLRPYEYTTRKAHFHPLPLSPDIIPSSNTFNPIQHGTVIMVYPHEYLAINMPDPTFFLIRYIFSSIAWHFRKAEEREDPSVGHWNGHDGVGSENDSLRGNKSYLLGRLAEVEREQHEQEQQQQDRE